MRLWALLTALIVGIAACDSKKPAESTKTKTADKLFINGKIYTVDDQMTVQEAMAIKNGTILRVGSSDEIQNQYESDQVIDLEGKPVFPGFIDGHCHFLGYARTLLNVDLVGTESFADMVEKVTSFFGPDHEGWVQGRGWDQNDWSAKAFPTKDTFDVLYPNNPVVLRRVDGHAALANAMALELAGITSETVVDGGEILKDANGEPTGILIDNAVDLVMKQVPENVKDQDQQAIRKAQSNCFSVGLTSLGDAGLPVDDVLFLAEESHKGHLKIRVYQMVAHDQPSIEYFKSNGPIKEDRFVVRSIKCYMDGALGSRGALLKQPYHDRPGKTGLQLTSNEDFMQLLAEAAAMNFQVCTHAIGDLGVQTVLDGYTQYIKPSEDHRWRIEHSQVVADGDMARYHELGVLPSIQPTHATSDMYWAEERLGDRVSTAYAYKALLEQHGMLISGSDFPVESINPLFGFYAAVARRDQKGYPENGFQMENALTREQALKAMTIWAAYGQFEEDTKGSLEAGKWADFVVLEKDIMTIPIAETFGTKVLQTFVNGELVYEAH